MSLVYVKQLDIFHVKHEYSRITIEIYRKITAKWETETHICKL